MLAHGDLPSTGPRPVGVRRGLGVAAALFATVAGHAGPETPRLTVTAYDFTTLAGTAGISGDLDGTGVAAVFSSPSFVAVDASGTVYVSDNGNNSIRAITPGGTVSTFVPYYPNYNFNGPQGVAVDASGNVYVADELHGTIDKVTPGGVVSLLAGGNPSNAGSPDGTGAAARFSYPMGIAVDAQGNVYVADMYDQSIRKVSPAGVVTTLAGSDSGAESGNTDGVGSAALFFNPSAVAVDGAGNVYVADTGNGEVRKVTPSGAVTTLAGRPQQFVAPAGVAVDASGNVFVSDNDTIREITPGGAITTVGGSAAVAGSADGIGSNALFNHPVGIAVDAAGNLYAAELFNKTIRKGMPQSESAPAVSSQPQSATVGAGQNATFQVTATGGAPLDYQWEVLDPSTGTFTALSDGGPYSGTATSTLTITGATGSLDGSQYECVVDNGTIPAVSNTATLTVNYLSGVVLQTPGVVGLAGQALSFTVGSAGDPLPTYQWQESTNSGSTWSNLVDGGGFSGSGTATLAIASAATSLSGAEFRAVVSNGSGSATSAASTLTVSAVPPGDVTGYSFTSFFGSPPGFGDANGMGNSLSVPSIGGALAIDCTGTLYLVDVDSTINTVTPQGAVGTRPDPGADFTFATAAAVDAIGNVYVCDYFDVWKVTPAGNVTRIAGTGNPQLLSPGGIAVDPSGNVYFSDFQRQTIQKITPFGVQSTFAGSTGQAGSADGQGSAARFQEPTSLASDASGNIYVVDQGNYTIRKITPSGLVSTLAGTAGQYGHQDGTGPAARLQEMGGITADASGNVFVVDSTYLTIRKIAAGGSVTTIAGNSDTPFPYETSFDGIGDGATFRSPGGIAVDGAGNLYVEDGRIRRGTPIAVSLGTATHFVFNTPNTVLVGSTATITVTAVNAQDAPVPGYSGVVALTSQISGLPQAVTFANGTATVQATFNSVGQWTVTATETTPNPITGQSQIIFSSQPLTPETLTVVQPPNVLTSAAPFALSVTTNSDAPVTYTVLSGPATIDGNIVTLTGAPGTVTIVVSQEAIPGFSAAPDVTVVFNVYASGVPPAITLQPAPQTANTGATAAFLVEATGSPPLSYQWNLGATPIAGATGPVLLVTGAQSSNAGSYTVTVTNSSGAVTSAPASLAINAANASAAPTVSSQPQPQTVASGSTVVFSVGAGGSTATTGSKPGASPRASASVSSTGYQWLLGGVPIAGATGSTLVVGHAVAPDAGVYSCLVTTPAGSVETAGALLTVENTANPGRLINVSCRANVGTGGNILITGFVVGGPGTSGSEPVLVRGSGPALGAFNVAGALADPQLQLYATGSQPSLISANTGWGGSAAISGEAAALGAFAWTNTASHDAALVPTLAAGSYTANITGESGDTGIALAEVYDATPAQSYTAASPRLMNVSTRVDVGTGGGILIAGFVIGGNSAKTVLIRASGPALAAYNVPGLLSQPQLSLYSNSTLVASNAGWAGNQAVSSVASLVGAFPWPDPASSDSAMLLTLSPGPYTVQVSGANGGTGVALVEVYDVP